MIYTIVAYDPATKKLSHSMECIFSSKEPAERVSTLLNQSEAPYRFATVPMYSIIDKDSLETAWSVKLSTDGSSLE